HPHRLPRRHVIPQILHLPPARIQRPKQIHRRRPRRRQVIRHLARGPAHVLHRPRPPPRHPQVHPISRRHPDRRRPPHAQPLDRPPHRLLFPDGQIHHLARQPRLVQQ